MRVKIAGTLILAASAFLLTLLSSGTVFAAETVLSVDAAGLELRRAALPAAPGNPRRVVDLSASRRCQLRPIFGWCEFHLIRVKPRMAIFCCKIAVNAVRSFDCGKIIDWFSIGEIHETILETTGMFGSPGNFNLSCDGAGQRLELRGFHLSVHT